MERRNQRRAALNDAFRRTLAGGKVMMTSGIAALPDSEQEAIITGVRAFEGFEPDNDPYGEHDFGALTLNGRRVFWKIDYYDPSLRYGSDDPSNPSATTRVLTIMLAEEY
jgi:hypothetical protein